MSTNVDGDSRETTYKYTNKITVSLYLQDMIKHMIQLDPRQRLSAKEYMSKYRGRVFPEEFYSFLKTYLSEFVGPPVLTSDEKIAK